MKAEGGSARGTQVLKRCRYGKDTSRFKAASKNIYNFEIAQWAVDQISTATPAANVAPYEPVFGANPPPTPSGGATLWAAGAPMDLYPTDLQQFKQMTNRNANGSGWNTFRMLGGRMCISEEIPTLQNPYVETFAAFKLDAMGFNGNSVNTFNQMCTRYNLVKQGPYAMTFFFQEPPVGTRPVVRQYPIAASDATNLGGVGRPTIEEHTIGAWEYMIIPPRVRASVKLNAIVGTQSWNRLIEMGFKPRPITKRGITIYCSNGGLDEDSMQFNRVAGVGPASISNLTQFSTITSPAGNSVNCANLAEVTAGGLKKSKWRETERVCQYATIVNAPPTAGAPLETQVLQAFDDITAQGYGCQPFGSAVVFRFRQFAPPSAATAANPPVLTHIATRTNIPLEIHIDTSCKWSQATLDQLDIDQQTSVFGSN